MIYLLYLVLLLGTYFIFQITVARELIEIKSKKTGPSTIQEYLCLSEREMIGYDIPKYKFFDNLISKLIKFRTMYGCEISPILKEIKKAVSFDTKASRKVKNIKTQAYAQFLGIVLITLSFHFMASKVILKIPLDFFFLSMFLVWNIFGTLIFICIITKLQKSYFKSYEELFNSLYCIKALFSISRPVNEIVNVSGLYDLKISRGLLQIYNNAQSSLKNIKRNGNLDLDNWDLIISEVWDSYEDQTEKFSRKVKAAMVLILMLFGLPSYLLSILNLIENLAAF